MSYDLIKFIASRLSQSNKRKGLFSFARFVAFGSIMLGTIALIISLSVLSGYEKLLSENAIKFTSHITVTSFNRKPLPNYNKYISYLKSEFPVIQAVAPVIQRESLIRSKSFIEGVLIKGVKSSYDITHIGENIIEGSFRFSDEMGKQIVIGKRLAAKLSVHIGDSVVVYAMRESQFSQLNYPDIDKFRITGIYETGMAKYDDMIVFIPYQTAAYSFKMPANSATLYEIVLKDITNIAVVSEKIEESLGYPHYCNTVFELHSSIFAWIELQKQPIPLVLGLITIVAVFNILTILLITVIEKTYSIGILNALGLPRKSIMKIFILKGMTLGLSGTLSGSLCALIFSLIQLNYKIIRLKGEIYFLDALPIEINVWHYVTVITITLVMSFIATLIPSYFASKANPIRAIHFK